MNPRRIRNDLPLLPAPLAERLRPILCGLGAGLVTLGTAAVLPLEFGDGTPLGVGLLVAAAVYCLRAESEPEPPRPQVRPAGSRRLMREADLPRFPPAHAGEALRLVRPYTGETMPLDREVR
ncbi:MAG: hypothetical protein RLZZ387_901 [Chloroflexota bacterium]|jgi:hypothetical protein